MGIVTHDRVRALKTLAIVDSIFNNQPVAKHQVVVKARGSGNHYNWVNGDPPELDYDLNYLHHIDGLVKSPDGRKYTRGQSADYLLGKKQF